MSAVRKSREPQGAPSASVMHVTQNRERASASRLLGEQLRSMRHARGLGLKDVAPIIRGSVSKLSRLERGESPPKYRDVLDLARHYGASEEQMGVIEQLFQQTENSARYQIFADVTPDYLRRLIELEGDARCIVTYESHVVPGLLQTPAYAETLVRAARPDAPVEDVKRRAKGRITRQLILRNPVPKVVVLLDEAVLSRPVGGFEVMCGQLEFLLEAALMPGVHIHTVPFLKGATLAPPYPVTHLEFGDGGPSELIYLERLTEATYVTRPKEMDAHRKVLDELRAATEDWEESRSMIGRYLERYRAELVQGQ
ncbi:helix-turn-helix domain-containing protein [Streptomyces sp. NPDC058391]|uniref:helix-turn-helix domain-containing protein n=1 Tax=Streptomyces sp. NPDC058391 TaxID=3346476 RepID=UPI003663C28D